MTEDALLAHATRTIHERAAHPKHLEILDELPKTAVGKVFKPELRSRAIRRVYNGAFEKAGLAARVTEVVDDRRRGLTARVRLNGATEAEVSTALGAFTRPWEIVD